MLCSSEDIKIYEEIDNMIKNGSIVPYDEDVITYLNTHSNYGKGSYMDQLQSLDCARLNSKYSRYLMIYLEKKGAILCDGKLSLRNGKFSHYWIELDDSVYDTTFIGKWDKQDFYSLFNPKDVRVVDLDKDVDFKIYKKNDKPISCDEIKELKYIDWYRYNKNNTISVFPLRESLKYESFPKQYTRKLIK